MKKTIIFIRILIASLMLSSCATMEAHRYHESNLSMLHNIAILKDYTAARVATDDRKGNHDFISIEPGETRTIASLSGPGEITHVWMTINTPDPHHLRNLVIRIYWEDRDFPSVESPIGDFFGLGHGMYYDFHNDFQAIGTKRGMNCFWPMPFSRNARIEVENQGTQRIDSFYYYVDWRKFSHPPHNFAYFHAQYRQEFPCPDGRPYLVLETDGSRGHFVGVNLSVHTQVTGWWGEGDDIFTIDGENTPSLWGTGTEDYFCGAWCYGDEFSNPYFGMPLRKEPDHAADNFWNVYRYHIENPITFEKSLKMEIEHGASGFDNTRKNGNNNDYSSVAYWYMEKPVPLEGDLPRASNRISEYIYESPQKGVFEAHRFKREAMQGISVMSQAMDAFSHEEVSWLNNDQLFCKHNLKESSVFLEFETEDTHEGELVFRMTRAIDYGKVKISLDGNAVIQEFNGYAENVEPVMISTGNYELPPGKHELKIQTIGKDERSQDYFWGMDYFRIGGEALEIEQKTEKINSPN